jgi:phosphoribosylanthranilate isomerase
MKVKVCGITSYADAAMALDQGVDALGFNFFPQSPRYVDPETARSITMRLPPFVATVGVFVNLKERRELLQAASHSGVRVLQLHGDETPRYCSGISGWTLIKALRLGGGTPPEDLDEYPVQAFLLDTAHDHLFGGTGMTFDWHLAARIRLNKPIILAGGLRPDNVGEAIRAARPYAVDVCSGVEDRPGRKDAAKLAAFMNEVRNVGF